MLGNDAATSASCIVRMTTAGAEWQPWMQAVSKVDELARTLGRLPPGCEACTKQGAAYNGDMDGSLLRKPHQYFFLFFPGPGLMLHFYVPRGALLAGRKCLGRGTPPSGTSLLPVARVCLELLPAPAYLQRNPTSGPAAGGRACHVHPHCLPAALIMDSCPNIITFPTVRTGDATRNSHLGVGICPHVGTKRGCSKDPSSASSWRASDMSGQERDMR